MLGAAGGPATHSMASMLPQLRDMLPPGLPDREPDFLSIWDELPEGRVCKDVTRLHKSAHCMCGR